LTVVNVTRIIASAMATAKILHTFPRRPLMGLDAPKADRDTDHDLAIASVLGSPPGPLADGRDATAGGLHSLALAAVPLSFLCHQYAHPFAAVRASLTRRT
jgi:hypothetical protein